MLAKKHRINWFLPLAVKKISCGSNSFQKCAFIKNLWKRHEICEEEKTKNILEMSVSLRLLEKKTKSAQLSEYCGILKQLNVRCKKFMSLKDETISIGAKLFRTNFCLRKTCSESILPKNVCNDSNEFEEGPDWSLKEQLIIDLLLLYFIYNLLAKEIFFEFHRSQIISPCASWRKWITC